MQTLPDKPILATELNISDYEYNQICSRLKRAPNDFELKLFSAMWSEHCGYKYSKRLLDTLPKTNALLCSENAGGIEVGEHIIVFKTESHNHPSAVEPFNGAATGVGGIIRDVLAMNARPIAIMNSLKFGSLQNPENKRLLDGVVSGISNYGNCIGVPNIGGETEVRDCYNKQPIINVLAAGIVKKTHVKTSKTMPGLSVIIVGSKTGRDGLGGAAFASKELEDDEQNRLSVQIADPFTKKKLIEATLDILSLDAVKSCQDCGAAGILSSTSEMAYKSKCGIELHLEKVHAVDSTITPEEIMLSESQERMIFTANDDCVENIFNITKKYELEMSVIGKTNSSQKYEILHNKNPLASLPYDVLARPPLYNLSFDKDYTNPEQSIKKFDKNNIEKLVSDINFCSKNYIYEQYDHTVQGRNMLAPESSNTSAIWLKEENISLGFSIDSNPQKVYDCPYQGTFFTIIESYKNLIADGFTPMGLTNCLNFGNPQKPDVAYQFTKTIEAMKDACYAIGVPVVSGNVSFYNEYSEQKIYPTPTIAMLGTSSIGGIVNSKFKEGDKVILIGDTGAFDIKKLEKTTNWLKSNPPSSCINITRGGVFGSLFRTLARNMLGFEGSFGELEGFANYQNCFIITTQNLSSLSDIEHKILGECKNIDHIIIDNIKLKKDVTFKSYKNTLANTMKHDKI